MRLIDEVNVVLFFKTFSIVKEHSFIYSFHSTQCKQIIQRNEQLNKKFNSCFIYILWEQAWFGKQHKDAVKFVAILLSKSKTLSVT